MQSTEIEGLGGLAVADDLAGFPAQVGAEAQALELTLGQTVTTDQLCRVGRKSRARISFREDVGRVGGTYSGRETVDQQLGGRRIPTVRAVRAQSLVEVFL